MWHSCMQQDFRLPNNKSFAYLLAQLSKSSPIRKNDPCEIYILIVNFKKIALGGQHRFLIPTELYKDVIYLLVVFCASTILINSNDRKL